MFSTLQANASRKTNLHKAFSLHSLPSTNKTLLCHCFFSLGHAAGTMSLSWKRTQFVAECGPGSMLCRLMAPPLPYAHQGKQRRTQKTDAAACVFLKTFSQFLSASHINVQRRETRDPWGPLETLPGPLLSAVPTGGQAPVTRIYKEIKKDQANRNTLYIYIYIIYISSKLLQPQQNK